MKRLLLLLLVAAILALTLSLTGCAPEPSAGASLHSATFDKYEADTEEITDDEGDVTYKLRRTGNAFVTLEDGTRVRADCPIQDVAQGRPVTVQQNPDGSWVVLKVLPEGS
jgi:hypothetical protein